MFSIKVPLREAEGVKEKLVSNKLLNQSFQIERDTTHVFFPINDKADAARLLPKFVIVDRQLPLRESSPSLSELLAEELTEKELDEVVKSFDLIGSIAIICVPEELSAKEQQIAEAIIKVNKNVKTILKRSGVYEGEFRTRKLKYVLGEDKRVTRHKEHGVWLDLDVEKVYFSPRSANERMRIAKLVENGESVLVLFSGCAPYPLVIAKQSKAACIYGVELNPVAHKFAQANVLLNKAENVTLMLGDAKKAVPKISRRFDRVVMPLPKTGELFLDVAIRSAKSRGILHFYDFANEKEFPASSIAKIERVCTAIGCKYNILKSVKCGAYAPYVFRVCIDFQIV
ncbi:MAG: class I SAM-dependent methyltransferase family protein [Candidatus Woesearchaeota archaeon]